MPPELLLYIVCIVFLYGIVIGSFLNVCIYRIPRGESVVKAPSHCTSCGYQLRWFDLIPIVSWLALRGHCRKCKAPISVQYPLVELANSGLYVLIFLQKGCSVESGIYCLMASALLVLSVIDERTFEIPAGINLFILILGVLHLAMNPADWKNYLFGAVVVSGFLELLVIFSKGRAIGGGDVKLMAGAGLLLGWQRILLAFLLGCFLGAAIHTLRIKRSGADKVLAFGPYLSVGIMLSYLWGQQMIAAYLHYLFGM